MNENAKNLKLFNNDKINVLQDNSIYNLDDYQDYHTLKAYDSLGKLNIEENIKIKNEYNNRLIYNQSLKTIYNKVIETIVDILNDISTTTDFSLQKIIHILTNNDRLIYVGIFLVSISIMLYIFDI